MNESLQELIRRIMREQGIDSVMALYRRLPDTADRVTYETVRKLANGEQRGTRDVRVFRDLAIMLRTDENLVRQAMNVPPTYGAWELPPRAQSLSPDERSAVMTIVDTILRAKGIDTAAADAGGTVTDLPKRPRDVSPADDPDWASPATAEEYKLPPGVRARAARHGSKSLTRDDEGLIDQTTGQDLAGEENQDGPDDPA